jgi:hypothetical protein
VQGLFPGCGLQAGFSASSTADPLFTAPYPENTTALSNAVLAHIGGSFQPIQTGAAALLSDLNSVLGCCSTTLCQSAAGTPACTIASLPYAITPSADTLSLTGGLLTGSSLAEIFELEYANGFTGTDVAFGQTDEAGVRSLMRLYTAKYRLFDRTPALARATRSNLALQMLVGIEGGAGKPVPGGPPAGRVTIFVGNDTTQSAVGGLLNLDWHQQSFNSDNMPPGGVLGFELLKDRAGRYFVRPVFVTITLDQMHAGKAELSRMAIDGDVRHVASTTSQGVALVACMQDLGEPALGQQRFDERRQFAWNRLADERRTGARLWCQTPLEAVMGQPTDQIAVPGDQKIERGLVHGRRAAGFGEEEDLRPRPRDTIRFRERGPRPHQPPPGAYCIPPRAGRPSARAFQA